MKKIHHLNQNTGFSLDFLNEIFVLHALYDFPDASIREEYLNYKLKSYTKYCVDINFIEGLNLPPKQKLENLDLLISQINQLSHYNEQEKFIGLYQKVYNIINGD